MKTAIFFFSVDMFFFVLVSMQSLRQRLFSLQFEHVYARAVSGALGGGLGGGAIALRDSLVCNTTDANSGSFTERVTNVSTDIVCGAGFGAMWCFVGVAVLPFWFPVVSVACTAVLCNDMFRKNKQQ
jgi:hypothetical protein